jgi:hypothetical protein
MNLLSDSRGTHLGSGEMAMSPLFVKGMASSFALSTNHMNLAALFKLFVFCLALPLELLLVDPVSARPPPFHWRAPAKTEINTHSISIHVVRNFASHTNDCDHPKTKSQTSGNHHTQTSQWRSRVGDDEGWVEVHRHG